MITAVVVHMIDLISCIINVVTVSITPSPSLVSNCSIDNCEDCGTDDCCKTCKINYFLISCGCVHSKPIREPLLTLFQL